MKRLMLVCMAVVFMFGYAGVSSAQNQPPVPRWPTTRSLRANCPHSIHPHHSAANRSRETI